MSEQPAHSNRGEGASQSAADSSRAHSGSIWGSTFSGWEKSGVLMNSSVALTWSIKYVLLSLLPCLIWKAAQFYIRFPGHGVLAKRGRGGGFLTWSPSVLSVLPC